MKKYQRFLSVVLTLVIMMIAVVPVLEVRAMSVSRDDGIWLFPLGTDRYNSFSDWASCPGKDKCVFCGVYHSNWGDSYHSGQGGHNGIDISAPINTNVYAAAPGTVIYAGYMGARGNTIIIEHKIGSGYSYYSYYQHLNSFVKTSGTVTAGTLIGKVGNSGGNYGYHLHFGIVRGSSNLGSSCLNTLEAKGWLIGSGNQGRILNNPSASNWKGNYAGAPKGSSAVLPPLQAHMGSVTYTFYVSQVTIGKSAPTTYTLTYNASGGTPAPASQSATAGSSVTVSSVFPERYGYVFKGWSATGTINSTLYQFEQPMTLNANTTLYAMWEEEPLVPENYVVYNGHTYLAFDGTYSQHQAQALCKNMGGHLATISSAGENQAVLDAALPGNRWYYWIGLNDEKSEGNYVWLNGEKTTYTNWAASEPTGTVYENAVYFNCRTYEGYELGQWGDLKIYCSTNYLSDYYHSNVGFVCELDYDITQPVETVTYNGSEYMVFDSSVSWLFAKQLANDLGGHLVTITNENENTVVKNLISGHSKNIYWLGGSDAAQQGTWSWVTGESFNYTYWNDGHEPSGTTGQDYLAMCAVSTSAIKSPGDWLDDLNCTNNDPSSAYYLGKTGFVVEKKASYTPPEFSEDNDPSIGTSSEDNGKLYYGDVNQDGRIDAADALLVLKAVVGKVVLTKPQTVLSEVSGDGRIDAQDALLILKKTVRRIEKFPIEQ